MIFLFRFSRVRTLRMRFSQQMKDSFNGNHIMNCNQTVQKIKLRHNEIELPRNKIKLPHNEIELSHNKIKLPHNEIKSPHNDTHNAVNERMEKYHQTVLALHTCAVWLV